MGHEAERAKRLIDEDPSFKDAIAVIRNRSDEVDELEWRDVKDDLTSGQWGRLIQEGVLEGGDDGFQLADREGIDDLLDEGYEPLADDIPEIDADVNWTTYDKLAGALTVMFMIGYWFESVRDEIGGAIYMLVFPLEEALPFMAVILAISMVTGLYSTLLQANLMDTEVISAYQDQMKVVQERRKRAEDSGDEEAMERAREMQMEAMGGMIDMFKAQFRPMVWITLLTIPLFLWLFWFVEAGHLSEAEMEVVVPIIGDMRWDTNIIGPIRSWIVWYFLCSLGFTQLMRKAMNIRTSPS